MWKKNTGIIIFSIFMMLGASVYYRYDVFITAALFMAVFAAEFFSLFDLKPSINYYLKLGRSESFHPHFVGGNQVVSSLA